METKEAKQEMNVEKEPVKEKKKKEQVQETPPVEQVQPDAAPSDEDRMSAELETLRSKLEDAQKEVASMKEQMLLDRADMENYRKRLVRDKADAVKFANVSLIKDLLQPLDDFGRAIEAAETNRDFDKMHDGVVMVNSQLYGILERNWGLEKIEAVGKEFNPDEHEACMVVEDASVATETVLEDFSTGYKLHGRVIRPAKVKVGKPNV